MLDETPDAPILRVLYILLSAIILAMIFVPLTYMIQNKSVNVNKSSEVTITVINSSKRKIYPHVKRSSIKKNSFKTSDGTKIIIPNNATMKIKQ